MKKRILSLVLCAAMLLSMCLFLGVGVMDDTTADGSAESTETTEPVDGVNIVSFTNAGPLVTPEQNVGPARVRALAANDTGSGVKLDKTVTGPDDDGNYTVRLEAYATGEQTTTVSTKPCDIVLVLDVSGSMDDYLKETVYNQLDKNSNINSNNYDKKDNRFVQLDDGTYAKVTITKIESGGWGKKTYTYTYTYTDENGTVHTATSSGKATVFTAWPLYYAEQKDSSVKKLDALKSAVNTFIEEVAKKETATVKHNISIVKFAGKSINTVGDNTYKEDRYEYNYSQIVMNLMDASDKQKDLMDAVNNLKAGGATSADYGMQHAQTVLMNARSNATKVVVMFTDGEPNHNNGFDKDVANDAISAAKELKASGATVYTVGCMNGADASRVDDISELNNTDVNKYMHLMSSNYKNATSMSNPGDATYPTDTSKSYYLSANNSTELNNVFESISQQIGGSKTDLTSTAVLKDAVTPYFEIPANAKVTLKTAKCTGVDKSGKLTFDTETDTDVPPDVEATVNGNTVSVTGFDYKTNWCGPRTNAAGKTTYSGQKLIVEFKIRPTNDFLGGKDVKTNVGTDDGIYESSEAGKEPVERFAPQNVDVAVKQVTVNDNKTEIYRGNSTNLEDLVKISDKLNSTNNAYVTTTYTIKDGDTTIATYTVKPGEAIGEWNTSTEVSPDSTHEYTVTCEVKNADSSDVQTAYAKLTVVVNTCSLKITKTVEGKGANPNQTFVFNVKDKDDKLVTTVVLKAGASTTITGLAVGDYTVVEDTNWSWSYTPDNGCEAVTLSSTKPNGEAKITNTAKENHWLTSIVDVINKWTAKDGKTTINNSDRVPGAN